MFIELGCATVGVAVVIAAFNATFDFSSLLSSKLSTRGIYATALAMGSFGLLMLLYGPLGNAWLELLVIMASFACLLGFLACLGILQPILLVIAGLCKVIFTPGGPPEEFDDHKQ
jgi:hypothetical protein